MSIVIVVLIFICHFLTKDSKELDFFISFMGTAFSILGIAITLDQIRQTKSKTEETQKAVEDTKSQMRAITKAFSITDAIRLAEGTEIYLRNKSQGESLIKLQEFSQILISINDDELKLNNAEMSRNLTRQMQQIMLDISSLNKPKAECRDIEWNTIISHIEVSKNMLIEQFTKISKTV